MLKRKSLVLLAAPVVFALFAVAAPAAAQAQANYPDKPIKLVVPYPPGGPVDVIGRLMAQKLGAAVGQTVFVENVPGANGNIGSSAVARATADGYTLLMGSVGPLTINPSLYPKMPYNTLTDFAPVALVAQLPLVVVVHPAVKAKNIGELIALAKAQPGRLTFGSAGNGSTQHLAGELFKSLAKIDAQHIPYKGAAPALTDVLAGRLDFMIELTPTVGSHIAAGKLRPLAVTTAKRVPALADVPTLEESGLANFEVVSWFGVLAPANTPKPIVAKINDALVRATRQQSTRDAFAAQGVQPLESTPAAFDARIRSDLARWAAVVKEANVHID